MVAGTTPSGTDVWARRSMTRRSILGFPDGSSATIRYLANANAALSKKRFEVSGGGKAAIRDDYRKTEYFPGRASQAVRLVPSSRP